MKRVIFIGQAPARPGSKHAVAGTYMRPWLYQLGIDEKTITEHFRFYALMGNFPGSDKHGHFHPSSKQILNHRPVLIQHIKNFQPDIIVPVGAMAIIELLPDLSGPLRDIISKLYHADPFKSLGKEFTIIPLPHPSGRSIWINTNPDKVAQALQALKLQLTSTFN
jgi:uracil-DNA glycosylase